VDKVLHCDCGFEARAADEEELVTEVQRHAREAHGMALSHDEALLLAFQAELGQHGTVADSPRSATPDPSNNTTSNSLGAGALAARDGDELDAIRSAGVLERAAVMRAVESAPQRTVTTAPS